MLERGATIASEQQCTTVISSSTKTVQAGLRTRAESRDARAGVQVDSPAAANIIRQIAASHTIACFARACLVYI